MVAGNVIVAL